jgi:para-aminobenzoate synthetase/4-amino-4-deoxychorismate lyase
MSPTAAPTVVRVPLGWRLEPERAALLVREDSRPFALLGSWAGGGALIGSEPVRVAAPDDDPFALLDEQPACAVAPADGQAVAGGWFGYLGYELGRRVEPVGASPPVGDGLAPFELAFYDHLLRCDRDGRWWFEALWSNARAAALRKRLRTLEGRAAGVLERHPFVTAPWRATPGPAGHELAVDACRARIHAGDLLQANICVRLESRFAGAPVDLFTAAVPNLRPDRAAFLAGPWGAIASLSPELFLERHARRVRSAPIKGTSGAPEPGALLASEKDRAENVMIVDLVRNDLGRVCVPGSIEVDVLAQARAHTGVWHLVSEVGGTLRDDIGDGALVRAAFPPGSVTGAPKVAAMNAIAELESTARGVYTGAIGFASPIAGLELSVAIRTFELRLGRVWLGVGGGIVADSDPAAETRECVTKAKPLLAAICAELGPDAAHGGVPGPARVAARPVPRPDPAAGVFETLLVADGRPVAVERHLSRLEQSAMALYGSSAPPGLAADLLAAANEATHARMRIDCRPGSTGLAVGFELTGLPERELPVRLHPRALPGGLGGHKWSDRRLLSSLGDEGEPLLCDLDGLVLEAGRANIFCVERDGRLVTPPADGRILPGVTRARVLELAPRLGLAVSVEPIDLDRLARAGELFLTGSLGGVEPAHLAGCPFVAGTVSVLLAEALGNLDLAPA